MTPWKRKEVIGDCTLYLGDCMEIMPTLGRVDAVVTDPPYGIGVDRAMAANSGTRYGKAAAAKGDYRATGWDDAPIGETEINAMLSAAQSAVIFGGNYFALPPARCWLIWDKENGANEFADCELAWTNLDMPVRIIRHMWNGMLRKGREERNGHPTQKPVALMEWCLGFLPDAKTILDPFMGSGTTGVACVKTGRSFIGSEQHEPYFDIACERIRKAYAQPDFFVSAPAPQPVQQPLFGDAAE
jgi:DNA modification methylase